MNEYMLWDILLLRWTCIKTFLRLKWLRRKSHHFDENCVTDCNFWCNQRWKSLHRNHVNHVSDITSQITSNLTVCSTNYSGQHKRKHQSLMVLVFEKGIHHSPVDSPHKGSVMQKVLPCDNIIMFRQNDDISISVNDRLTCIHCLLQTCKKWLNKGCMYWK